jgi:hypothetical protein
MEPEEIRQTIASQIAKIYLGEVDSEPTQEEIELEAKIQEYLDSDEFKEAYEKAKNSNPIFYLKP